MTPIIEDSVLGSDLDARFYDLLHVGALDPPPLNLATSDHVGLTDSRPPLPGSVTNDSVAADAAIDQVKLNLNGQIPSAWLGTSSGTAAQGDLAEYVANKNQPGGYAGLDGSGKIPSANLPPDTGVGSVTSVGLIMPTTEFGVAGSPVTGAGTLEVTWRGAPEFSWFGNKEGLPGQPQFYVDPLPVSLIPNIDAAIVTSGVFDPARLPIAVGVGPSHAPGAVPDPGSTGDTTDYLARDMSYKAIPVLGPGYQPQLPDVVLSSSSAITGPITVTPTSTVSDVTFFYSLTSATADFVEFPEVGYLSLAAGATMWAYSARPGYINSDVVTLTNTNAP